MFAGFLQRRLQEHCQIQVIEILRVALKESDGRKLGLLRVPILRLGELARLRGFDLDDAKQFED